MPRITTYLLLIVGSLACQEAGRPSLSDETVADVLRAAIAVQDSSAEDSVAVRLRRVFAAHGTDEDALRKWIKASRDDPERGREVAKRVADLLDEGHGRDPAAHRGAGK